MRLALFDIDGTLVAGSTERRFWRYLLRRGQQGPRQVLAGLWFLLRHWPLDGAASIKRNKAYLVGLAVDRVATLAAEFVAADVLPNLRAPVVERLRAHQHSGDTVVLLSGTLEPIARSLAAALGVREVSATVCHQRDGRYTARPPEVHPFGATKLDLARRLAASLGADLREAAAYGDSHHDLPLLRAVGAPVAVQPDAALLAAARTNRWDILATHDGARAGARLHVG